MSRQRVVQNAFFRFPGLLFDWGLSDHFNEVIAVKVEAD